MYDTAGDTCCIPHKLHVPYSWRHNTHIPNPLIRVWLVKHFPDMPAIASHIDPQLLPAKQHERVPQRATSRRDRMINNLHRAPLPYLADKKLLRKAKGVYILRTKADRYCVGACATCLLSGASCCANFFVRTNMTSNIADAEVKPAPHGTTFKENRTRACSAPSSGLCSNAQARHTPAMMLQAAFKLLRCPRQRLCQRTEKKDSTY